MEKKWSDIQVTFPNLIQKYINLASQLWGAWIKYIMPYTDIQSDELISGRRQMVEGGI